MGKYRPHVIREIPSTEARYMLWQFLCEHATHFLRDSLSSWGARRWPEGEPACPCELCKNTRKLLGLKLRPEGLVYVQRMKITDADRDTIVRLQKAGHRCHRISRMIGLDIRRTQDILQQKMW